MENKFTARERLAALEERWNALRQVILTRTVEFADDPVGRTGYYTRTFKVEGSRSNPVLVEEYSLDTELLREMRALEQEMADERLLSKQEVVEETGNRPSAVAFELAELLTLEELQTIKRRMEARTAEIEGKTAEKGSGTI